MLLVERQALNEAIVGEKNVRHVTRFGFSFKVGAPCLMLVYMQGNHHMPETRGLCLSEEQTVSSVWYWTFTDFAFTKSRVNSWARFTCPILHSFHCSCSGSQKAQSWRPQTCWNENSTPEVDKEMWSYGHSCSLWSTKVSATEKLLFRKVVIIFIKYTIALYIRVLKIRRLERLFKDELTNNHLSGESSWAVVENVSNA